MGGISGQKFSLPQPKKVDARKKNEVMSQGDEIAKGGMEDKKDTGLLQIKYCPPEKDDNLNISKEGLNLIKDKDKKSEVTLEEIRERILNRPEKETPAEKIEEFVSGLESLDKDKKIDFPSILEGTPEEMKISRDVFGKLSKAGEIRRRDIRERGLYMGPDADKEEVSDLWMYDGSAPGSVSTDKEKVPEVTDQKRLLYESHKIMEKLGGKNSAEEETDNVMGGKTHKKYGIRKDGKDIALQESHETKYEDKEGNSKKDSSVSVITRYEDGSYTKYYGRQDSDGNTYTTKLNTEQDGSSERTSEASLKDGTKINSTETKDKDGKRKIASEEIRPDGSKIYKEKILDENGKGKVIVKDIKADGRTVSKKRETGNVPEEVSEGNEHPAGIGGKSASFWDNIFPPDELKSASRVEATKARQSPELIYPVFDIDTNGGDKISVDTGQISYEAGKLLGKPINRYLDPEIPRDEKLVCIDVIDIAYKNSGIDLLKTMQYAADNDISGYETSLKNAYEDSWMVRRVPNWYKFFEDNGLLNKLGDNPEEFPDGKPYQTGDVLFIEHRRDNTLPNGKKEYYWLLDHSAIVTSINPDTGLPKEIVAASWPDNEVHKFTWEEWKDYLEKPEVKMSAYGGFREEKTLEVYKNPDYIPSNY